jgi:hypothetical protein
MVMHVECQDHQHRLSMLDLNHFHIVQDKMVDFHHHYLFVHLKINYQMHHDWIVLLFQKEFLVENVFVVVSIFPIE